MRKISMKRKSRTPNSESSEIKEEDKSGDESVDTSKDESIETPQEEVTNGPSNKKSKKSKRISKAGGDENGTDKKSPKKTAKNDIEETYEVEAVLDDKMVKGVRQYLIRWKGYEEDSDTWEPESTLSCPDLISAYLDSKDSDTKKSAKRGKQSDDKLKKKKKKNDDDEKDEGEYEVDKIIEVHHKRNGKREFLVHWKGYSPSENTWEPEEHMNCPDLIDKFMTKVTRAKSSDTRELRVNRQPTERFTLTMEQSGRKLSRRNLGKQRVHYHDNE